MSELIFDKSKKNLKKVYNRLTKNTIGRYVNREDVLFLAIGGYNRTYELLLAMGVGQEEIATFSKLDLTADFLNQTHLKKVVYIRKLNYVTSVVKGQDYSRRFLDLNIADGFEESMMIYKHAQRQIGTKKKEDWIKPSVVILDDQSLNLQYGGHRFYYQTELGFCQVRNRNAEPYGIIQEIASVEEAKKLMFVLYQEHKADEAVILDILHKLKMSVVRSINNNWYLKPSEFKKIVGSNELIVALKELPELAITQLQSNKKIGKENARWIVIPDAAFEFKGFEYKDEEEKFAEEVSMDELSEQEYAKKQEAILQEILFEEFPLNFRLGYVGNTMHHQPVETLHSFLGDIDGVEQEQVNGIELLSGASTNEEYKYIKKHKLAYFLDGEYKNNERTDQNYLGGKQLVSIDIDDGNYSREEIEYKLEQQNLFGLVYPTAKYYFDGSLRWRIILMADKQMDKEEYKQVVTGIGKILGLEVDEASKKLSQLMGYPLVNKDVSIVIGTKVNVAQFQPKQKQNVVDFTNSTKSLMDFDHSQALLLKEAIYNGIPKGRRNESYRQIILFLRDTITNQKMERWHKEAQELEEKIRARMVMDGLPEKEVELICR